VVDSVTWYCTFCGICADCGATDPDVAAQWNDPDVEVCQCYAPKQREAAREERDDWTGMTWSEYLARRPGPDSPDDDITDEEADAELERAYQNAMDRDGDGYPDYRTGETVGPRSPSLAPPWSEHRPDVSHGLGVPTSRKPWNRELDPGAAQAAGLSEDLVTAVTAARDASDRAHGYPSAVNPPAVFPDADRGYHHAARNGDLHVVGHEPNQDWARVCLRCAARWPHPIASADIHPESDCPGCSRCAAADAVRITTGAIHVIPAHLAGESDLCKLCQLDDTALAVTGPDDAPAQRAAMRALDEEDADALSELDRGDPVPGLISQESANRYLHEGATSS
jgi:hypothetical protein